MTVPDAPAAGPPTAPAGEGAPGAGRARAFRQAETLRRREREGRSVRAVLIVAAVLGAALIVTAPPNSLLSGSGSAGGPGPPVEVTFGAPSVSTVTCGAGGTAYAEVIPWTGSSRPVTTGDIDMVVYAIFNGDNIGLGNSPANATASNVCEGSPPSPTALWYVVLQAPNGTNVLTYTIADSWTSLSGGSSNVGIANESSLVLVTDASLAGTGRGLKLIGFVGESVIEGAVVL